MFYQTSPHLSSCDEHSECSLLQKNHSYRMFLRSFLQIPQHKRNNYGIELQMMKFRFFSFNLNLRMSFQLISPPRLKRRSNMVKSDFCPTEASNLQDPSFKPKIHSTKQLYTRFNPLKNQFLSKKIRFLSNKSFRF